jgi:phosphatidate cytidylyltransferase
MMLLVIYLSVLLLGIVAYTAVKKTANKKSLYLKFTSFAVVVGLVYAVLDSQPSYTILLYSLIGILSLFEIVKVTRHLKTAYLYIGIACIALAIFTYAAFKKQFPHSELFLCVLSFDAFSQFFGQIFGKHALWKTISPHKTMEGTIGGLVTCTFTSSLVFHCMWKGLFIGCSALCGDLLASFVKRRSGVKDFSNLLPAQGGILDRFDSYIISTIAYLITFQC